MASGRTPFRNRKPKLGAEPRNVFPPPSGPPPYTFRLKAGTSSSPSLCSSSPDTPSQPPPSSSSIDDSDGAPPTHFKITLHRSSIGLPDRISRTLEALGIHRRMQTVYHRFSPDIAGKILQVKELVEVRNVTASEVRTPEEARKERKAVRGYEVVSRARPTGLASTRQALHAHRHTIRLESTSMIKT